MDSDHHAGRFGRLLTPSHIQALGNVNKNWFHDLSLKACDGLNQTPHPAAQDDSAVYPSDGQTATPRGDDSTQPHNPMMSTPLGVAPPLFSPAGPQGATCGMDSGSRWKRVNSGSILSPATPGVGGVVPGLGSVTPRIGTTTPGVEAFTPLSTLLCPHNTSDLCGFEEGSDVRVQRTSKDERKVKFTNSIKRLFKTPSSMASGLRRNQRVVRLTGIDLNHTDVSWTESLATPSNTHLQSVLDGCSVTEEKSHDTTDDVGNIGVARMLFSPRGAAVSSQGEGILPLNSTIPEDPEEGKETESLGILDESPHLHESPHLQICDTTEKNEFDVMATKQNALDTIKGDIRDVVTPTDTRKGNNKCWHQSTYNTNLTRVSESCPVKRCLSGDLLHSGRAEIGSLSVENNLSRVGSSDISILNISSEVNRFELEAMLGKGVEPPSLEDGTEDRTMTGVDWTENTEECHTKVTESNQKTTDLSKCGDGTCGTTRNLSTNMEDEREAPFTSPSQTVSVREALSIFDTPPSCATVKKKSVPRRSKRHRKVAPHADRFDDETPSLLMDNKMVEGGCDSSEVSPQNDPSKHGVNMTDNQVEILAVSDENPTKMGLKLCEKRLGSQDTESREITVDTNQNKRGCESTNNRTSANLAMDEIVTAECLHQSDNEMIGAWVKERDIEVPLMSSTQNDRVSPMSKPGGDDGFTQISQATLSAACEAADNISAVFDRPVLTLPPEGATISDVTFCMKSQICAYEKQNPYEGVGEVKFVGDDNNMTQDKDVCDQECVDRMCEDKDKVCSACGTCTISAVSSVTKSKCHISETVKCVACSTSHEACCATSEQMCSASHRVRYAGDSKACSAKKEVCSTDSYNVCSATKCSDTNGLRSSNTCSCTNTQCVNTDVKMCSAKTEHLKCDNGAETDRIVTNEEIAFTQISPSMMGAIFHVTDSAHDPCSTTTLSDAHPSTESQADLLCSDWLESRSHKSCTIPSEMTCKHSSSDGVCKAQKDTPVRVHTKTLSKQSPVTRTVVDGCNVGGTPVAKQPGSNTVGGTPVAKQPGSNTVGGTPVAKQPRSNTVKPKTLSLSKRKTKKFSYPSIKQISNMCPQRVFNLTTDAVSVGDVSLRNTVGPVEEISAGKTESTLSERSHDRVPVTASDSNKGLVCTEAVGKAVVDVAPSKTLCLVETLKDKRNGRTNPICPTIEGTGNGGQLEQERDNASTGKGVGQSLPERLDGKPCLGSTSRMSSDSLTRHSFSGFATASNKAVSFSKAALETAQKLVTECDINCSGNSSLKATLVHSAKVHCGISANTGQRREDACHSGLTKSSGNVSLGHVGFKTASAKPIQVSDGALKKALALVDCVDSVTVDTSKKAEGMSKKLQITNSTEEVVGSSTCSGVADLDSMEAESRVEQNRVEDTGITSVASGAMLADCSVSKTAVSVKNVGFHMASRKAINVSDRALAVAQKLVENDIDVCLCDVSSGLKRGRNLSSKSANKVDQTDREMHSDHEVNSSDGISLGPVNDRVSVVTESGVCSVAESEETFEHRSGIHPRTVKENPVSVSTGHLGFQCASGKTISVAKESLGMAVKLVDSVKDDKSVEIRVEDDVHKHGTIGTDVSARNANFAGFQSASGKAIVLKEESIKKAKQLVDCDDLLMSHGAEEEHSKSKPVGLSKTEDMYVGGAVFPGFHSASGKEIRLTEQSLEKARTLIHVSDEQMVCENSSTGANKGLQSFTAGEDCIDMKEDKPVCVAGCDPKTADRNGACCVTKTLPQSGWVRSETNQCVSSETKDYSHLPKGFRPFKAPRMVAKKSLVQNKKVKKFNQSFNEVTVETTAVKSPDEVDQKRQKTINLEVLASNKTTGKGDITQETVGKSSDVPVKLHRMKETEANVSTREQLSVSSHSFDDEGFDDLTYTQISEITDLTVVCLQHQHEFGDSSFGQTSAPVTHSGREREDKDESKRLSVIVEETISGNDNCAGKEGCEDMDISLPTEGDRIPVMNDVDYCDNVCDNLCDKGRGDKVRQTDISGEESFVTELSVGRDAPLSSSTGNRTGLRGRTAGKSENLLADISQLSEWEGDEPISDPHVVLGSEAGVGDSSLNCHKDRSNSLVVTIGESTSLSLKYLRGVSREGCSRVNDSSALRHSVIHANDEESAEVDSREVQPGISTARTDSLDGAAPVLGFQTARGGVVRVSEKALVEAKRLVEDTLKDGTSLVGKQGVVDVLAKQKGLTGAAKSHAAIGDSLLGCTESLRTPSGLVNADANELRESEIGTSDNIGGNEQQELRCSRGNDRTLDESTAEEACRILGDSRKKMERLQQIEQSAAAFLKETAEHRDDQHQEAASGCRQTYAVCSGMQIGKDGLTRKPEKEDPPCVLIDSTNNVHGFHTAAGKKVAVSDKALTEAKNMFSSDGVICENSKSLGDQLEVLQPKQPCDLDCIPGFKTASGKTITVSEKSLEESRKILDTETNSVKPKNVKSFGASSTVICTNGDGFAAAKADEGSVMGEGLRESKKDDTSEFNCKDSVQEKIQAGPINIMGGHFIGFTTARGNKVSVSEKALKESRKVCEGYDVTSKDIELKRPLTSTPRLNTGDGFTTAKGNRVCVSETALKESRKILDTNECSFKDRDSKNTMHLGQSNTEDTHFTGFATARGNAVSISEKALKKSRKILDNNDHSFKDHDSKNTMHLGQSSNAETTNFTGFATARGIAVSISEKALKESRKILDNNECSFKDHDPKNTMHLGQSNKEDTHFTGFATARGNAVSISEKALKESRKILDNNECSFKDHDSKNTMHLGQSNTGSEHFIGFATARGNKVTISDKALKESRQILANDEYSSSAFESKNTTCLGQSSPNIRDTHLTGFATARGSKVSISDKALKESRKMLAECENQLHGAYRPAQDLPEDAGNVIETQNHASLQDKAGCILTRLDETISKRDIENDPNRETVKHSEVGSPFHTASGSKVHVSDSALAGARCMLGDGDDLGDKRRQPGFLCMKDDDIAESDIRLLLADAKRDDVTFGGKSPPLVHLPMTGDKSDDQLSDQQCRSKRDTREGDVDIPCTVSERVVTEEGESDSRATRWQHRTSTPMISDHDRSRKTAGTCKGEGITSLRRLSRWLSPITSSPDECLRDRVSGSRLAALRSHRTTPVQGDLAQRDASSVGTPLKGVTPQRPSFMGSNKKHSSHQPLPTGRDTFAPPFKKNENSFSTPYKPDVQTSFKTPMKSSGGPDQLRKRLAFAEKTNAHPEKKLKLDDGVRVKCSENEESEGSVNEIKTTHRSENVGKNNGSELQQNHVEENANLAQDVSVVKALPRQREVAHKAQLGRIAEKRRAQSVKPVSGKLFALKAMSQRISLKDAVFGVRPGGHTVQQLYTSGVRTSTLHVTAANAEEFRFTASEYFASENLDGVRVGDRAFLIFHQDGTAGKEEFCNAFLDMAGVEPALVSEQWVVNHYRWVVWKLAAMEVAFPECFAGRSLTPDLVMLQLKYRYDREIDHSHRSALKKIYERDDVAQKTLVLCVSDIRHQPTPGELGRSHGKTGKTQEGKKGEGKNNDTKMGWLELTDGWYPIRASLDAPLTRLVAQHKIQIGDKLCICAAELIGPREGAPPLQGVEETSLKLSANCTRRARWDAKLGYTSRPHPMLVSLGSLYPDGGTVGGLDVTVTRVYPLQFMEKLADGSNVFRSARAEEKEAEKFDRQRQRTLEEAYGKIQTEFESRFQEHSADGQDDALRTEFQERLSDLQQELPSRTVVSLLKVRLAGLTPADVDSHVSAVLNVWRPAPEVVDMLTEGRRFKIYHLTATESRSRGHSGVALTATRTTRYLSVPVDDNLLDLVYEPREVVSFDELRSDLQPPYGEVDVAGVVVRVSDISTFDRPGSTESCVQTVYLADCTDQMMAVKFWRGLAAYGLKELLTVGAVVAGTNLQWRYDSRNRLPTVTANELSVFTVKPRQAYQSAAIHKLQTHLKETPDFVATQQCRLQQIFSGLPAPVTPQLALNTTRYKNDYCLTASTPTNPAKNRLLQRNTSQDPSTTPVSTVTKCTASTYAQRSNPPRLLLPSTPGGRSNDAKADTESPLVARQRAIQRAKARRLESYGNPMQHLSPLPSAIPVTLRRAFKSPLVTPRTPALTRDSSSCDKTLKNSSPIDNNRSSQGHAGKDFSEASSRVARVECCDVESGGKGDDCDPQNGWDRGAVNGIHHLADPRIEEVSKRVAIDSDSSEGLGQTGQGTKRRRAPSLENSNKPSPPVSGKCLSSKPSPPVRRKSLRLSKQQTADS